METCACTTTGMSSILSTNCPTDFCLCNTRQLHDNLWHGNVDDLLTVRCYRVPQAPQENWRNPRQPGAETNRLLHCALLMCQVDLFTETHNHSLTVERELPTRCCATPKFTPRKDQDQLNNIVQNLRHRRCEMLRCALFKAFLLCLRFASFSPLFLLFLFLPSTIFPRRPHPHGTRRELGRRQERGGDKLEPDRHQQLSFLLLPRLIPVLRNFLLAFPPGLQDLGCEEGERGAIDGFTCRPHQRGDVRVGRPPLAERHTVLSLRCGHAILHRVAGRAHLLSPQRAVCHVLLQSLVLVSVACTVVECSCQATVTDCCSCLQAARSRLPAVPVRHK